MGGVAARQARHAAQHSRDASGARSRVIQVQGVARPPGRSKRGGSDRVGHAPLDHRQSNGGLGGGKRGVAGVAGDAPEGSTTRTGATLNSQADEPSGRTRDDGRLSRRQPASGAPADRTARHGLDAGARLADSGGYRWFPRCRGGLADSGSHRHGLARPLGTRARIAAGGFGCSVTDAPAMRLAAPAGAARRYRRRR